MDVHAPRQQTRLTRAEIREKDLYKIFESRHGSMLPDSALGRTSARIMIDHIIQQEGGAQRALNFAVSWCPWLSEYDRNELVRERFALALIWGDQQIAVEIGLYFEERSRTGYMQRNGIFRCISSIAAVDADPAECRRRSIAKGRANQAAKRNRESDERKAAKEATKKALSHKEFTVYEASNGGWISVPALAGKPKVRRLFGKIAKKSIEKGVYRICKKLEEAGKSEFRKVIGLNKLPTWEVRRLP